ncbi:MAG: hypothetical protein P4M12_08955 [Gammaproteobacteria bacterium]|nr:hypothetical protein [Gammaproteobacteria bacterium]
MNTHFIIRNLFMKDISDNFLFGSIYNFSASLCKDLLTSKHCTSYQIDMSIIVLNSVFEMIYGFSYATAARTLTLHAADHFKISPERAELMGNITYSAVSLAQDLTPVGMFRTTLCHFGKLRGYEFGLWAESRLPFTRTTYTH